MRLVPVAAAAFSGLDEKDGARNEKGRSKNGRGMLLLTQNVAEDRQRIGQSRGQRQGAETWGKGRGQKMIPCRILIISGIDKRAASGP